MKFIKPVKPARMHAFLYASEKNGTNENCQSTNCQCGGNGGGNVGGGSIPTVGAIITTLGGVAVAAINKDD